MYSSARTNCSILVVFWPISPAAISRLPSIHAICGSTTSTTLTRADGHPDLSLNGLTGMLASVEFLHSQLLWATLFLLRWACKCAGCWLAFAAPLFGASSASLAKCRGGCNHRCSLVAVRGRFNRRL
jgi:hypothetical protein